MSCHWRFDLLDYFIPPKRGEKVSIHYFCHPPRIEFIGLVAFHFRNSKGKALTLFALNNPFIMKMIFIL